jgi:hypothetical protein
MDRSGYNNVTTEIVEQALADLAQRPCNQGHRADGFTYVLMSLDHGTIKIGKAEDPRRRVMDVRNMNAGPLTLLSIVHGAWLEALLHGAYREHRLHGEWFAMENPVVDLGPLCYGCTAFKTRATPDQALIRMGKPMTKMYRNVKLPNLDRMRALQPETP